MSTVPSSENQESAVSPSTPVSQPETAPAATPTAAPQETVGATAGTTTTVALVTDPEAASTAGASPATPEPPSLDRYECRSCGYVYEPTDGDGRRNVAPGTLFEEVPETWICPVCRAPKVQFINIGPKAKPSGFDENLTYGLGVNTMTAAQKRLLIFGSLVVGFLFLMSFYGLK